MVPQSVTFRLSQLAAEVPSALVVLDLANSRWETETLLRTLSDSVSSVRSLHGIDVVLVVATDQAAIARVVEMLALSMGVTLYVAPGPDRLREARPVGKVTPVELETLSTLRRLGGRITASKFAHAASIEVTAAGNRLTKMANRGYVNRISRSRRDGDEYVSVDWLAQEQPSQAAAEQAEEATLGRPGAAG